MKKVCAAICLSIACMGTAVAAPPSDASLRQLMNLTNMQQMMSGAQAQFDGMFDQIIQKALADKPMTKGQQAAIEKFKGKMKALLKEQYDWAALEPQFIQLYKKSLTQEEVNGMITFYKSPAGLALTKKMPAIMQQAIGMTQSMLEAMLPKIEKIQQEFTEEMKAAEKE